jgi:DNA-binding NarL/FixJ family response regulator
MRRRGAALRLCLRKRSARGRVVSAMEPTPPLALVLGDPDPDCRAALRAAGFAVASDGDRATVAVLALTGDATERLAQIAPAVAAAPDVPLIVLMPSAATGTHLRRAVQEGASGVVGDDDVAARLGATALAVAAGQLAVPPALARRLVRPPLSHREKEIMQLVACGYTNRQIATALFVAESTVKTHLSSALRKLDVRSRAEATALILDPDEGQGLAILTVAPDPRKIDAAATVA